MGTVSVEVKSLKKGGFCMIRDQPCKITEMTQKPKATSKGNDRIHLVGLHMATGKKYEDTLLATLQIEQILVSRETYDVLNLEKSDNPLEKYSPACTDLVTRFEAGEDVKVVVLGALGQETIVEVIAE